MYVPLHFAFSDLATVHTFLRTNVFATIAAHIGGSIELAYAPIAFDANPTPLGGARFHLARANPLSAVEDGASLKLSVIAPHAYVSPDWYASQGMVPTWNYVAVEGTGRVRKLSGAELKRLLSDLSAHEERALAPKPPWTMARVPPERLEDLLTAIIGFELVFDALEGKAKLSQNRTLADREGAIEGLEKRGDAASIAVAAAMRDLLKQERG